MTLWQGVALGLVQGLAEFLPVSSSGHLRVLEVVAGVRMPGLFVEVALHVATLASIVVVYWRRLWQIMRGVVARRPAELRMAALLVLGTLPAGIVGVLLHDRIQAASTSLTLVGTGFILTGCLNWSTRWSGGARRELSAATAVGVGCAQAVAAVFRGVSRSGATVCAALWGGVGPVPAVEFSFLLAIPAIAGAALLEAPRIATDVVRVSAVPLAVSVAVAFVSGIWSIRFLLALLRRRRFDSFAPYCWAVGVLTIAYGWWRA